MFLQTDVSPGAVCLRMCVYDKCSYLLNINSGSARCFTVMSSAILSRFLLLLPVRLEYVKLKL